MAHDRDPGRRGALLFDLDGTLIDSDPLHAAVFRSIFADRGIQIDEDFYLKRIHGRLNADIFAEYFPHEDPHALSDQKEVAFRARLQSAVPPTPGLDALLDRVDEAMLPVAVVTNAPRANADIMLDAIRLRHRFPVIVVADDCARGKPHPDPYLDAMAQLGALPKRCVAFEDSPSGLRAAAKAGAYCIGMRSSLSEAALVSAGAEITIDDFGDPRLGEVIRRQTGVSV